MLADRYSKAKPRANQNQAYSSAGLDCCRVFAGSIIHIISSIVAAPNEYVARFENLRRRLLPRGFVRGTIPELSHFFGIRNAELRSRAMSRLRR